MDVPGEMLSSDAESEPWLISMAADHVYHFYYGIHIFHRCSSDLR